MIKLTDGTFWLGSFLVLVALGLAVAALMRDDLPVIGAGTGALLAVAVVGMAGCAVGGISQATTIGWTAPTILFGAVVGVIALVIIAAGLFGWTGVLQPVTQFVPVGSGLAVTTARTAIFALAVVFAVKWVVAIGMAATAR